MESTQHNGHANNSHNGSGQRNKAASQSLLMRPIGIVVAVAILVALGALVTLRLITADKPAGDRYQAVFLDNNQVFFGKLKNTSGEYMTLEKAYYTKASDLPADATAEQKAATASNVSLIKVGDEVYGPENVLKIRAEQVLFWQDLKSDSKVAKAIDSAK